MFLSSRSIFISLVPVKSLLQFHIVQNVSSLPRQRRSHYVPPHPPPPRRPLHILKSRVNKKGCSVPFVQMSRESLSMSNMIILEQRYEFFVCFLPRCLSLLSRRHVSQRIMFTSYDFVIYFRQRRRAREVSSPVMATSLRISSSLCYFYWSTIL